MSEPITEVRRVDLASGEDARAVVEMLDAYARDPFGASAPLPDDVRERLIPGLRAHPTTVPIIAYRAGQPVGVALCFRNFSSWAAREVLNLHDLFVVESVRGMGVSRALLDFVAEEAKRLGCAKVTLEVLVRNARARGVYDAAGFEPGVESKPEEWTLRVDRALD